MGVFLTSYNKSPLSTIRLAVEFRDALKANGYRVIDITGFNVHTQLPMTRGYSWLNGSRAFAYVSGGVVGQQYPVRFEITLKNPGGPALPDVILDRTIIINVVEQ